MPSHSPRARNPARVPPSHRVGPSVVAAGGQAPRRSPAAGRSAVLRAHRVGPSVAVCASDVASAAGPARDALAGAVTSLGRQSRARCARGAAPGLLLAAPGALGPVPPPQLDRRAGSPPPVSRSRRSTSRRSATSHGSKVSARVAALSASSSRPSSLRTSARSFQSAGHSGASKLAVESAFSASSRSPCGAGGARVGDEQVDVVQLGDERRAGHFERVVGAPLRDELLRQHRRLFVLRAPGEATHPRAQRRRAAQRGQAFVVRLDGQRTLHHAQRAFGPLSAQQHLRQVPPRLHPVGGHLRRADQRALRFGDPSRPGQRDAVLEPELGVARVLGERIGRQNRAPRRSGPNQSARAPRARARPAAAPLGSAARARRVDGAPSSQSPPRAANLEEPLRSS